MRFATTLLATALAVVLAAPVAAEPFTFRGHLDDGLAKAQGNYALRLTLYSHEGSTVPLAGPLELLDVSLYDGQFAVDLDFGPLPAYLTEAWLEVAVMPADDSAGYVALDGRSRVALKASEVCPAAWALAGNSGTSPGINYLGTSDAQPLEVRVNNQRVARFESNPLAIGTTANVLLGSPANVIDVGVRGSTIAGGGVPPGDSDPDHGLEAPNRVTDAYGSIGGGYGNTAGDAAGTTSDAASATVGGGLSNTASGYGSTVSGGFLNTASGSGSSVGGGDTNIASGNYSIVGNGSSNAASGSDSAVGGGERNTTVGEHSVVGGGLLNCAGSPRSWAGGFRAKVRLPAGSVSNQPGFGCDAIATTIDASGDHGTFIWADSQPANFVSTGPDQFNIRASGGVRLDDSTSQFFGGASRQMLNLYNETYGIGVQTSTLYFRSNTQFAWFTDGVHAAAAGDPGGGTLRMRLDANGNLHTGGAINPPSDRNLKTAIEPIDTVDVLARVLALPLSEWSYKTNTEQRHIGPMAQDFHAAFGLNGDDDKSIATIDADGVALAAIQGLNAKLEAENAELREELRSMRSDIAAELAALRSQFATHRAPE